MAEQTPNFLCEPATFYRAQWLMRDEVIFAARVAVAARVGLPYPPPAKNPRVGRPSRQGQSLPSLSAQGHCERSCAQRPYIQHGAELVSTWPADLDLKDIICAIRARRNVVLTVVHVRVTLPTTLLCTDMLCAFSTALPATRTCEPTCPTIHWAELQCAIAVLPRWGVI